MCEPDACGKDRTLIGDSDDQHGASDQDNRVPGDTIRSDQNSVCVDERNLPSGDSNSNEGIDVDGYRQRLQMQLLQVLPSPSAAMEILHWCTKCDTLFTEDSLLQEHRTKCLGDAIENILGKDDPIVGVGRTRNKDPDVQRGASDQDKWVQERGDIMQGSPNSASTDDLSHLLESVGRLLSSSSNDSGETSGNESVREDNQNTQNQIPVRPGSASVRPGSASVRPGSAAVRPGSPAVRPGSPAVRPGSPAVRPGSPAVRPGSPAVRPGSPAVRPGSPAVRPGSPAVRPGSPAVRPGSPAVRPGSPAVRPGSTEPSRVRYGCQGCRMNFSKKADLERHHATCRKNRAQASRSPSESSQASGYGGVGESSRNRQHPDRQRMVNVNLWYPPITYTSMTYPAMLYPPQSFVGMGMMAHGYPVSHQGHVPPYRPGVMHGCPNCRSVFASPANLLRHRVLHH